MSLSCGQKGWRGLVKPAVCQEKLGEPLDHMGGIRRENRCFGGLKYWIRLEL